MKRWMMLGILVLLVQVGLTVATHSVRHADSAKSGKGPLLKLTAAEVNEAVLEDGEGRRLIGRYRSYAAIVPAVILHGEHLEACIWITQRYVRRTGDGRICIILHRHGCRAA